MSEEVYVTVANATKQEHYGINGGMTVEEALRMFFFRSVDEDYDLDEKLAGNTVRINQTTVTDFSRELSRAENSMILIFPNNIANGGVKGANN